MKVRNIARFSPGRTVLASIIGVVILGTLILALPICRNTYVSLPDLFFTATSATCVTGLATATIEKFNTVGQIVFYFSYNLED